MPSVFDLFGELGLKTDAFEGSLKSSVSKMQSAEVELDKVIAKSNKLGDTSATVARRYDKLNDGIQIQKQRLADAVVQVERGDISYKKFQSTIASVDKSVAGLSSRIKDANARAIELQETGFTHFQNQIRGGVTSGQLGEHGLINLGGARPLQGLGPVLQGLGLRQYGIDETILNILIVAAREAGILKVAQEGTAAATAAAAAAEAKFASSATSAAAAESELAVASASVEASTAASATSITIFGAGIIPLVAVAAALGAGFLAIHKASEDIRKSAEDRLKTEEAIAGALNKQYQIAVDLKAELAKQDYNAQFSQYLKNLGEGPTGVSNAQNAKAALQSQFNATQRAITEANARATAEADREGLTGKVRSDYINGASAGLTATANALAEQIKGVNAQLKNLKAALPSSVDIYQKAIDDTVRIQKEGDEQAAKAQKQAADAAKEFARKLDESIRKVEADIKRLSAERLKEPAQALEAAGYARQAQEFRQGFRFGPESASQKLQRELTALIPTEFRNIIAGYVSGGGLPQQAIQRSVQVFNPKKLSPEDQHAIDQQIVKAAQGLNPADLTSGQRDIVAGAFQREADFVRKEMIQTITDLKNAIKEGGALVTIKNQSDKAQVTQRPTSATTETYYNQNQ